MLTVCSASATTAYTVVWTNLTLAWCCPLDITLHMCCLSSMAGTELWLFFCFPHNLCFICCICRAVSGTCRVRSIYRPIINKMLITMHVYRLDAANCKRINVGGSHAAAYMQRLLQLKYPAHQAAITPSRMEELLHHHCYVAADYQQGKSLHIHLQQTQTLT